MMDNQYKGQIVVAEITKTTDYSLYKILAKVLTGDLKGDTVPVAYRGDPSGLEGKMIIRLWKPHPNSGLDSELAGHFLTSKIPDSFEFASSSEVILYGLLEDRMREGYDVPSLGRILNYYCIGVIPFALYYAKGNGNIIPYGIVKGGSQIMYRGGDNTTPNVRNEGNALRKYLSRMNSKLFDCPRIVIIDDAIDMQKILTEFERVESEFKQKFGIKRHIEMEPQQ